MLMLICGTSCRPALRLKQVSGRLFATNEDVASDDEGLGGALGPADIKEELFDNVNVHYRQPEVSRASSLRLLLS